jgi:5'(3')-deoxyribonucleotidase
MIYIDLDNTLFDFTSAYFAGFKRKYGVSLPKETFTRYDFYNHPVFINLMADLGRWDYKAAAFAVWEEGHFFRDLALFEGAKEAVERLCSLGVCFVTDHVSEGCEKDKREAIKREFGELKVMKGGGGDVILLMLTRIGRVNMFCERDFLIDDNPFVLEGGDRSKIFIFDNVYNRGIHCKRINGWGEVKPELFAV